MREKKNSGVTQTMILCVLALFFTATSIAQSKVTYVYDADGNRTSRTVTLSSATAFYDSDFEEEIAGENFRFVLSGTEHLIIESIKEPSTEMKIIISQNEKQLAEYRMDKTFLKIDFSEYERGSYTLHINNLNYTLLIN